jgi:hypothetical protein
MEENNLATCLLSGDAFVEKKGTAGDRRSTRELGLADHS